MIWKEEIAKDTIFFQSVDRRLSKFENLVPVPEGISYNSYIILAEKTAILDCMEEAGVEDFILTVQNLLQDRPLDYLILNHVEPDHTKALLSLLAIYPDAQMVMTRQAKNLLGQFFREQPIKQLETATIVGDGDTTDLGSHVLRHVTAPMVHWPEVMMTYDETTKVFFSADAFGSFKAPAGHHFADQVNYDLDWLGENRRYYFNIVGARGPSVQAVLKKAAALDIKILAPLHGLIFRTPETIAYILDKYQHWSTYQPEEPGVVIVYGSMYGNSAKAADLLAGFISREGCPNIRVYDVSNTNDSYILSDLHRFSHGVFFCNNYNAQLYRNMDFLLRHVALTNYDNRRIAFVYNMSWGGKALDQAREILSPGKNLTEVAEPITIKSALDPSQVPDLQDMAKKIAEDIAKGV